MKGSCLIFSFLIIILSAKAQYSYGGEFSFMHFFGPTKLKHFGLGLNGEYQINEWTGVTASTNYFLPQVFNGKLLITGVTPDVDPYLSVISVESRVGFTHLGIGGKRYFLGRYVLDEHKPFGMYGTVGFGLLFGAIRSQVPQYDKTLYSSPINDEEKNVFINWMAGAGIGAEFLLGKNYLYVSVLGRATIDQANPLLIKTNIPVFLNYNLGMRVPFSPK